MLKKKIYSDDRISFREFIRYQISVIFPYRYIYGSAAVLMLLAAIAGYILPATERRLINLLTGSPSSYDVWLLFVITAILFIFVRMESLLQALLINSTVQKVMYTLRTRITKKLLEFPIGLLNQLGGGYLAGRLSEDLSQVKIFFSNTLFSTILNILKMIGGLIILLCINRGVGVFVLFTIPFYLILLLKFRDKHYRLVKQTSEEYARNQRSVTNSLGNINSVKSHAAEGNLWRKLKGGFARETILRMQTIRMANIFSFLAGMIPLLCEGLLLAYGVFSILQRRWDLGTLWAINRYVTNVFTPLRSLCTNYLAYQTALASVARLLELERNTAEPRLEGGISDVRLKGEIELHNVSFSYHSGKIILENCNLIIKPGQHIIILGESGVGKSTLFALLLGFYQPQRGQILFDKVSISDYNLRALRKRIGYIGAIGDFLNGSIRENLLIGCSVKRDDSAIMDALEAAGVANLIHTLPKGLDSTCDEARSNFSFGEQLRLALARELLRDCDMLLLDEATANLDHANENKFLETIFQVFHDKTIIMIRHTPHALTDTLPTFLLEHGQIFQKK